MKKLVTLIFTLLCLICMVVLGGCSPKTLGFTIDKPEKVTITSISGEKIEVVDKDMIQQITDNITSIQFERGKSSKDTNGFGPIITWYDSNGDVIETLSVMSEDEIMYNDYFWTVADGRINVESINNILSTDTPQ